MSSVSAYVAGPRDTQQRDILGLGSAVYCYVVARVQSDGLYLEEAVGQ